MKRIVAVALLLALVLAVIPMPVATAQGGTQSFIVIGNGQGVNNAVAAAGGVVVKSFPQIGVSVAESSNPDFASSISGVQAVARNMQVSGSEPVEQIAFADAYPPFTLDDDFFFDLQYGHTPVGAQEAWAAGVTGEGVRVFVLDDGIDSDHPDLAPNLNVGLSTSFVPGQTFEYNENFPGDPFSHGSHVSGTIAAADNAYGTIGVAPDAELVMVKVLDSYTGSGDFDWIIEGILYAADNGADVINMSLGTIIPQGSGPDSAEIAALRVAVNKAITYAHQQGAVVIVSAGNDALDLNAPENASLINFEGYASHAVSISSVGPLGWATDPLNAYYYYQSSYTNVGPEVDFAAPGGTFSYPGNEACIVAGLVRPCWVFDLTFSTGSAGGWYWSAGTSMAAPHAAGVAALIISENGGEMNPSHVIREMRQRAYDPDGPGASELFGYGVVNSGY